MRRGILLLIFSFCLFEQYAQTTRIDSVQLNEVQIKAAKHLEKSIQTQSLDSNELYFPTYKDLGESLQQNANLFIKSYGNGSMASISLRGTNSSQTQLFWNGVSLNSAAYGSTDLALFPTFFLDAAHINYGLSSLQYGSGGLGGAVSLENKTYFNSRKTLEFTQDIGSFGQLTSAIKIKIGNTKWQSESKLFYREADHNFTYINLAKERFPEEKVKNAGLLQKGFLQSFHYRLTQNTKVSGHFWYFDSDRNLPPLMTGTAFQEYQKDQSLRSLLSVQQYFSKAKLSIKGSYIKDNILYENERSSTYSNSSSESYQFIADFEYQLNKKWFWNNRINLNYFELTNLSFQENNTRDELSSFHQLKFSPTKKWLYSLAVRQLYINQSNFWMPSISFQFVPDTNQVWKIGGSLGQNIKYPSLNDLYLRPGGNSTLKEEISQTAEINVSKHWRAKKVSASIEVASYLSEIEHYILWQPSMFGYWQVRNLKAVQTKGVEVRAKTTSTFNQLKIEMKGNYTYSSSIKKGRSFANDASNGKQLIYIPEHQYNLSVRGQWKSYGVSIQQQFIGARYTTTDNLDYLPFYTLTDATISKEFRLKKQIFYLSFSALNIFNTEYQAIQWRPMPSRNYLLRLKLMLNS